MTRKLIQKRLHADLDTPVSAYLKLRGTSDVSFLFESVEGNEVWASYSIIGVGARRIFRAQGSELEVESCNGIQSHHGADPLAALRAAIDAESLGEADDGPRFVGGVFGYLAYDAVRSFEKLPEAPGDATIPDAFFVEPEILAVFDNRQHSLTLFAETEAQLNEASDRLKAPLPAYVPSGAWREPEALDSREHFQDAVLKAQEEIRAGEIIQAVLSRRFAWPRSGDPFNVYRGLRTINPSPYLFYFQTPELQLAGASPEVMVRVLDGEMVVRPIAGTRPRGQTALADRELERALLADPKERAEHIMLVDLGRNDVGRVCSPGSVDVANLMVVERYSHVMHIVSEVRGQLGSGQDAFEALRAAFPAGTLSGAPKVRAMEIICQLENRRRGIYGGAVGYFGPKGDADFGIAIRTLEAHPDRLIIQAGAGIVADSDPATEADETEHKAQAVIRAARWATSSEAAW